MTGGDFSLEAYQQLREAYANETNTQLDAESQGVEILGQKMTLETLPVDSPWRSQIDDWQYPSGRSQYLDEKQDPAEILEIMRGSAKKLDDAEKLEEAKELVAEAEAEEAEEVEETDDADDAEDEDLDEMSDEDFDKFIAEILEEDDGETDGVGDDEVEDESADETEDNDLTDEELDAILEEVGEEDEDEEEEEEEEEEEKEDYDPQVVADEISRLRAELDNMRFVPEAEQAEDTSEEDSP